MNYELYRIYANQKNLIAKAEQNPDVIGEEEKSLLADLKLSHAILDEKNGKYLARYKIEQAMFATFTSEQKDFICYQIGDWYLKWKSLIVNLDGTHRLGYAKEDLKTMLCGE